MTNKRFIDLRPYREVIFLTIITVLKLMVFHRFMGITEGYWQITLLNGLTAASIYLLVNMVRQPKRIKFLLGTHLILSILFFANTMYFSHFYTLLPVHIFYQAKHLKGVSSSVGSLLRLDYLLFFGDVILLFIIARKEAWVPIELKRKNRLITYLVIILMIFSAWGGSSGLPGREEGYYTPFNLGMINYHFYDLLSFMGQVEAHPVEETMIQEILEEPHRDNGQYFGLARGKNVFVIQAESLQSFVLQKQTNGQWITPVLNNLIENDSFFFSRYYEQVGWGNTSDAEFVSQTGLHASLKNFSYKQYEEKDLVSLPKLLKRQNYQTAVFHGNEESFWNRNNFYPTLGVDNFISLEDLEEDEIIGMGLSDRSLFRQSITHLKSFEEPFYSFYITLTSHYPYTIEEEDQGLQLDETYQDTILGGYFQTVNYLDRAIGEFIEALKEAGLYENSIIIIYGDHHGIKLHDEESSAHIEEFLGKEYLEDEMLRVPLIIHVPNSGIQEEITRVGGQVDFLPTVANLMGIDISPFTLIGRDLLNTTDSFALNQIHTAKGSFIQDDVMFIMARDGIFENSKAWNIKTGEPVDIEQCRAGYERAMAEIQLSEYILENNLIMMKNKHFWEH
ncbi:LTA synthase family protein [Alkaliphilus crotonatoxidans]